MIPYLYLMFQLKHIDTFTDFRDIEVKNGHNYTKMQH